MIKSDKKQPTIIYDPSLDKYEGIVLFKEKLERAKEIIKKAGLPKKWINDLEPKYPKIP